MTSPSASTWYPRDYPVLVAAAERLDTHPGKPLWSQDLAEMTGKEHAEVVLSVLALGLSYLAVKPDVRGDSIPRAKVLGVTEKGRRASGLWPSREDHLVSLVAALKTAEQKSDDPEERTMLRKAQEGFAGMPAAVLTAWLSGQIG